MNRINVKISKVALTTFLCFAILIIPAISAVGTLPPSHKVFEEFELNFSENPEFNKPVELTLDVEYYPDYYPNVTIWIDLPDGFELVSGDLEWQGDFNKDAPVRLKATVRPIKEGEWVISGFVKFDPHNYGVARLYTSVSDKSGVLVKSSADVTTKVPAAKLLTRVGNPPTETTKLNSGQVGTLGTITITGHMKYVMPDLSEEPIRHAKIKVYDDLIDYVPPLDPIETWTDDTGKFTVSGITDDGEVYRFEVYADTEGHSNKDAVVVKNAQSDVYMAYANNVPISSSGDIGNWTDNRGAWHIFDRIVKGHDYLFREGVNDRNGYDYDKDGLTNGDVWNQPKITVYWPESSTNYWIGPPAKITVKQDDWFWGDFILHEYGHAVRYNLYGDSPPSSDCPQSGQPHGLTTATGLVCAMDEGWSTFYLCAVKDSSSTIFGDLETVVQRPNDVQPADKVEGAVGGIYWDIYDTGTNEGNLDELSMGISPIWDVLINKHPGTVHDFWDGWENMGYNKLLKLWAIYSNHGINKSLTPPDTSPPTISNVYTLPIILSQWQSFDVYATIEDPSGISSTHAIYTTDAWQHMSWIPMNVSSGDVYGTSSQIPGQPLGTDIEYGICTRDNAGKVVCEGSMQFCFPYTPSSLQSLENISMADISSQQTGNCVDVDHSVTVGCSDTDAPSGKPSITMPSTDDDGDYSLSWTGVTEVGCSGFKDYEVWESVDSNFPESSTTIYRTTSTSYSIAGKGSGTYYYQVRGVDQAENPGTWSDPQSIQVTAGGTSGDSTPPVIEDPYTTSGALCADGTGSPNNKAIFVRADDTTTGGSNIAGGTLYYRGPGGSWSEKSMSPAYGSFNLVKEKLYASLGPFSSTGTVSYYVSVRDAADNTGSKGSQSSPYSMPVVDCTPPPAGTIDDFTSEAGKTRSTKGRWEDWNYNEVDTGSNYVEGLASYESRDNVGRAYTQNVVSGANTQSFESLPSSWNFADPHGSWTFWVNNEGDSIVEVALDFEDSSDRTAHTVWKKAYDTGSWTQMSWRKTRDIEYETSGFNWGDVKRVEFHVDNIHLETTRDFYFDDLMWTGAAVTKGSVIITSDPSGAEIWIDGSYTGYLTPATLQNVEQGSHFFTLKRHGYSEYTGDFNVLAGQENTVPEVTLLDGEKPEVTISSPEQGSAIKATSLTATWSGVDSGSGIDHYEVRLDGGSWTPKGLDTSHTFSGLSEGSHTLHVRAVDGQDLPAVEHRDFIVDVTLPSDPSPVAVPGGWTDRQYTVISWSEVYDPTGISSYEYQVDSTNGDWISVGTGTSFITPALSTGQHVVYVRAIDGAGNEGEAGSVKLYIDASKPMGSIVMNGGAAYTGTQTVTLSVTYSDQGSGPAAVRYSNDGVWDTEPWDTPSPSKSWTLTAGDGQKRVYYQVKDGVNRTSDTYSDTIVLDTARPVVQNVWHDPETPTANDQVTVYATVFDQSPTEVSLLYSTDNLTWEKAPMLAPTSITAQEGVSGKKKAKGKGKEKKKFIVKYKEGKELPPQAIEKAGGKKVKEIRNLNIKIIETSAPGRFVSEMKKNKHVIYVEEAQILTAALSPSDGLYTEQWALESIQVPAAWEYSQGEGVVVAVLDTGIDYTHPELDDNYIVGYDFVNDDADPMDDNGHGTYVAGIIAGELNGEGIVGVAPGSKILAEKVLDEKGVGYDYHVAQAIVHAVDNGADVISMSLGGGYSRVLAEACEYAYNKGVLLVGAAGNTGGSVLYPAALSSVIAVSSTGQDNALSSFSSHGSEIELAAPGGGQGVISTDLGGEHTRKTGTSASAAHVSGVVALAISLHESWNVGEIRSLLHASATDLGEPGWDEFFGYGLVDAGGINVESIDSEIPQTPPQEHDNLPSEVQATKTYSTTIGPFNTPVYYRVEAVDIIDHKTVDDNDGSYYYIPTVISPIDILSPKNTTYGNDSVPLVYNVGKATVWEGYSLDGSDDITTGGFINTFSDGSTTKELTFSSSSLSDTVYVRIPEDTRVVGTPKVSLQGYNFVNPVSKSDTAEKSTTSGGYVLVKEFTFEAKKDYKYELDKVEQSLAINYDQASSIGKITYQIGGGQEVTAFEDVSSSLKPQFSQFLHDITWNTNYGEKITVKYYLKRGPPAGSLGTESLTFSDLGSYGGKAHSIRPVDTRIAQDGIYGRNSYNLYVSGSPNIRIYATGTDDPEDNNRAYWRFTLYDGGVQKGSVEVYAYSRWGLGCSGSTLTGVEGWLSNYEGSNGNLYVKVDNFYCSTGGPRGWFTFVGKIGFDAVTTGSAYFTSNPTGASIWIDGSDTGQITAKEISDLSEGTHAFVLKKGGYADYSGNFQVTAGQKTTVPMATLTPLPGDAAFSSNPSGASIWIDGTDTGQTTPATISNLAAGSHTYVLKLSGYKDYSGTFSVQGGQRTTVPTAALVSITAHAKNLKASGYEVSTYPQNVYTDSGADSTVDITLPGELKTKQEIILDKESLNNYIASHSASEDGYVVVPIKVGSSTTGKVELSGLSLNYRSNATLSNLTDGGHKVEVYSQDINGNVDYRVVHFTVDTRPVEITVVSPVNTVYTTRYVDLNYTVNKAVEWAGYSLDGGNNVTLEGNTTLILEDGEHNVVVYANDSVGRLGASERVYFTIQSDSIPPVTIDDAPEGWQNANFTVNLTARDNESGVNVTYYRLDGKDWAEGTSIPIDIEGNHTLEYYSIDNAGNEENVTLTYAALDKTIPSIDISGVTNGSYYNVDVAAHVNVTDLNLNTSEVTLNGGPYSSGTVISEEGDYLLEAIATDLAGNSVSESLHFTVDKTLPTTEITSPINESYIKGAVEIIGAVADLNLDSVAISIDDEVVANTTSFQWDTTGVSDGTHNIELVATDKANNSASIGISVIVDNTLPELNITRPDDGSYLPMDEVTVGWNGVDNTGIDRYELVLDGGSPTVTEEASDVLQDLSEGLHSVEITAYDLANNSAQDSVSFTVDTILPSIVITGVAEGYFNAYVTPYIEVSDSNINSTSITLNDGPFASGTMISTDGVYTLDVYADDLAGNNANGSITFTLDTTPPNITIVSPSAQSYSYADSIVLDFSSSDETSGLELLTADLDGTPVESGQTVEFSEFSLGGHTLSVTAADFAGNDVTQSVTFTVIDDIPPETTDDADEDWHTSDILITLASDDEKSTVKEIHYIVNDGTEIVIDAATAQLSINYEDDNNSIRYWAVDEWDNAEEVKIVTGIKLDKMSPVTTDDAGSDWYNRDITVTLIAIDPQVQGTPSGVSDIYYIIYEDEVPLETKSLSVDGPPVITYEDDDNWLEYWSVDVAGNEEEHVLKKGIKLDKTSPTVSMWLDPAKDEYFNDEPLPVNYEAVDPVVQGTPSDDLAVVFDIDGTVVADPTDVTDWVGTHTLTAMATDLAGNNASASITFTIDLHADINIDPDTLNLYSNGNWISAYIEFPSEDYDIMTVDIGTVTLNGVVLAENNPKYDFVSGPQPVDKDEDGLPEFMVKFDRNAVGGLLSPSDAVTLSVSGEIPEGTFKGTDTIRVITNGNNRTLKEGSLKVDKKIKPVEIEGERDKSKAEVNIDLIATGNTPVKAVQVKEYIPEEFSVNTFDTDAVFTGFGLAWYTGTVDKKEALKCTLTLPEVTEPTTYEFKTVVEYQTSEDLESIEKTSYLIVNPKGQVKLDEGKQSKNVKAKGKGYSKVRWGLPNSNGKGGDSASKGKKKGHDKDKPEKPGKPDKPDKPGKPEKEAPPEDSKKPGKGGGKDKPGKGGQ